MGQPCHVNQGVAGPCLSPCPVELPLLWGQEREQGVMGKPPSGKPSRASQELECPGLWGCWNVGLAKRRSPRVCLGETESLRRVWGSSQKAVF